MINIQINKDKGIISKMVTDSDGKHKTLYLDIDNSEWMMKKPGDGIVPVEKATDMEMIYVYLH
jgi:hypothetical protein